MKSVHERMGVVMDATTQHQGMSNIATNPHAEALWQLMVQQCAIAARSRGAAREQARIAARQAYLAFVAIRDT